MERRNDIGSKITVPVLVTLICTFVYLYTSVVKAEVTDNNKRIEENTRKIAVQDQVQKQIKEKLEEIQCAQKEGFRELKELLNR